jgi:[acyl-carrier-protein] S-malonyltransferase
MGRDWFEVVPAARARFEEADRILGFKMSSICFNGPEEELRQTQNTQPAIFLHSVIVAEATRELGVDMMAGHSLGEYSALVAANAMSFEEGLKLVRLRGRLMQAAGDASKGTMAAIVGLSPDAVTEICAEASAQGIVQPANFNSPGQIVVSGSVEGVRKAIELAKLRGAKLAKELVVSGAFHSPLMESARNDLKRALDQADIRDAEIPVYTNVTAEPVKASRAIREMLCLQLTSPVRWEQTIRNMVRDEATQFYELGPGKVLQGLVRRTEPSVSVSGVDQVKDAGELVLR